MEGLTKTQVRELRKIRNSVDGVFLWETGILQFLARALGMCGQCGKLFKYPKISRQNTAYDEDVRNFTCMCKECLVENDKYWEAMWEENGYG